MNHKNSVQMFCKHFWALLLWCHCYDVVLNPLVILLSSLDLCEPHLNNQQFGLKHIIGHGALFTAAPPIIEPNRFGALILGAAATPIEMDTNPVVLTPGHEIVLRCSIAEFPTEPFSWYRTRLLSNKDSQGGARLASPEEELKSGDERFIINNNVLTLKYATLADQGEYFCRVKNPRDDIEHQKTTLVRAKPYIYDFVSETISLRSAVVEEGKALRLVCNVFDDYTPESNLKVSWHMSKFEENDMTEVTSDEEGIKLESLNSTSITLIIDRVTKDHRRFYKCHASNGVMDNNKVILIRVKDKYTILWPTVGILLELVMLIGVICVVENRKVEPDKGAYERKAAQM